MRLIAFDAAFVHQAWSVKISSIFDSTIFTHLGSVTNFNPNMSYYLITVKLVFSF
jgi:hypothetical protein